MAVNDQFANPSGANPYNNADGGRAVRVITPCDDGSCGWQEGGDSLTMAKKRWYPTIEGLAEGNVMVIGGDENGGYVSTFAQNTPSWEYWPKQESGAINMDFLNDTVPVNLFPLVWLLPSGKVFFQAAYRTILYDIASRTEQNLVDMPYAQRIYPATGAAVMLPLTPANGYSAELLFCGGSNVDLQNSTDGGAGFDVTKVPADNTCVRIRPDDESPVYTDDDNLPEARCMGQLIYLPDGKMWMGNGVGMGTAGYGNNNFSIGQSYGQEPLYMPAVYDPNAPAGKRFSRDGLSASTEERMYHSTAILLADGSVLISGSNPNADVTDVQWGTKYSVEKWYPTWYNEKRPKASGFPASLSYVSVRCVSKADIIGRRLLDRILQGQEGRPREGKGRRHPYRLQHPRHEHGPALPRARDLVLAGPRVWRDHHDRLADASQPQHLPAWCCDDLPGC